jgi:hypothetical protein
MMMTYTSAAPGTAEVVITRLDLASLGVSKEMGKKKSLHYVLHDVPTVGWKKEILVRSDLSVKSVGQTSTRYIAPDGVKILRSKVDVISFFAHNKHLSSSLVDELDFRSAFCVCHCPEDTTEYLECACGLGGCNHWFHARCVGMSAVDVTEFRKAQLICPLCTLYLEVTGNAGFLLNKWVLRCAPSNPASYVKSVFKLPTIDGTVLQRKDANIYVNGLVFKPALVWKSSEPIISKYLRGKKRKADSARSATGSTSSSKKSKNSQHQHEEHPYSALNEDDFLQLEAFLSPDPIESINDTNNYSNNEDEDEDGTLEEEDCSAVAEDPSLDPDTVALRSEQGQEQQGDDDSSYRDSGCSRGGGSNDEDDGDEDFD